MKCKSYHREKETGRKGFTVAELLIVVAIIAVLVAVSIPIFRSQLEKSREAVDLANVRSAYSEVMHAVLIEDTSSPVYQQGRYQRIVPLKQTQKGWTTDTEKLMIGGISQSDKKHWRSVPRGKGYCKVYYTDDEMYLNWCGEDHINTISAADFLTKDILETIVGKDYRHTIINSNERYEQGGGTKAFIDYAKEQGFDLTDYDAATWQIYVKESVSSDILSNPAIYWSTVELTDATVGKSVPVIGYRNGKYDVYCANVVTYNQGTDMQYNSISNNFANVTEEGGKATFQFDNYEDARKVYNEILAVYQANGTLTSRDMADHNLRD